MATANILELEACMIECIAWCQAHSNQEISKYFLPRLKSAAEKMRVATEESDACFLQWRKEEIEDKLAWKHLSNELRSIQRELKRTNVLNFPNEKLRYWDTELLGEAAERMVSFLNERAETIPAAVELSEGLQRRLTVARSEEQGVQSAFHAYSKQASTRSQALGLMGSTLYHFRDSMRRHLGKRDAEYLAMRWPFSLNSDRNVL